MTKHVDAKVITLTYELRHGSPTGEVIEVVDKDKPAEFLFGVGKLVKRFEDHVIGLNIDEKFEFVVPADEAYGPVDEQAIVSLPKDAFIIEGKLATDILHLGNVVNMQDQNGNPLQGKIIDIETDIVKMDFNHPLAGMDLHFKGQVINTREAAAEEVSHGHVHTGHHGH